MSRKEVEMSKGTERLEAGVQPLSVLLSGVPEAALLSSHVLGLLLGLEQPHPTPRILGNIFNV